MPQRRWRTRWRRRSRRRGHDGTQWALKSALWPGKDALDFGVVVEPNQDVTAPITFGDKTQELNGTIQDTLGNPTADYTIIVFAGDKNYWVPQARDASRRAGPAPTASSRSAACRLATIG